MGRPPRGAPERMRADSGAVRVLLPGAWAPHCEGPQVRFAGRPPGGMRPGADALRGESRLCEEYTVSPKGAVSTQLPSTVGAPYGK